MITASCHCGSTSLEVETAPSEVTDCNCSICRRYGTLWAYYSPKQVKRPPEGTTQTYMWGDKDIAFHRCPHCGCVTHWFPVGPARDRMGINANLMAPEILASAKVLYLDGADTWQLRD